MHLVLSLVATAIDKLCILPQVRNKLCEPSYQFQLGYEGWIDCESACMQTAIFFDLYNAA